MNSRVIVVLLWASASLQFFVSPAIGQVSDPTIINWLINTTGATGASPDPGIHALVSEIPADVTSVFYTDDSVYVQATGVPSYESGPFGNNRAYPSELDSTYQIARTPVVDTSGNNAELRLGAMGVFVNGVGLYNFSDGRSYNNQGVWNEDANFNTGGFDAANGHPSPIRGGGGGDDGGGGGAFTPGRYHHHQNPISLRESLGDDGTSHSPLLGFAFDGFPVYSPYGFEDPTDPFSSLVQIESSYQLRDITDRSTLADGTVLAAALHGPSFEERALGNYQEDFGYEAMSGHLDEHNGRFTITPDYPDGTYAYFVTLNDDGTSAYPHMIGPTYYGELVSQNGVVIPNGAVQYVPEPSSALALAFGMMLLLAGRKKEC